MAPQGALEILMADKISGPGFTSVGDAARTQQTAKTTAISKVDKTSADTASTGETVSLTRSALILRRLEELIAAAPAADTDRIAALKEAIASGSYEIDAQSIADKIMRMERDLG
jgi:negative regulator of flagellin synthesis FlgM